MRVFTTICLAATLAFTAHAATISKRAISGPVNQCLGLMDIINTDISDLTTSFKIYQEDETTTPADNIFPRPSWSKTEKEEEKLRNNLAKVIADHYKARPQCCAINSSAEEDSKAISAAFESYATAATNAMNILNSKVSAFDKKNKPYYLVKEMLLQLPEAAGPLQECLAGKISSAEDARKAYDSKKNINNAVKEASETFQIFYRKTEGEVSFEGAHGMMASDSPQPEAPAARLPDSFSDFFAQPEAPASSSDSSLEFTQSESPASSSDTFFAVTQPETPAFSFDTQLI